MVLILNFIKKYEISANHIIEGKVFQFVNQDLIV